jgi:calcineurin-like phosphoesterase family protein
MNTWFTSDEHYFHNNILKYCARPFQDIIEMNENLIEKHNKVVNQNDIVYHLGDLTFRKVSGAVEVLKRLNGRHRFLRGNHDEWLFDNEQKGTTALREVHDELLRQGSSKNKVEWIKDYYEFRDNGTLYCLMHFPLYTWHHSYKGSYNLYGHVHATIEHKISGKQMDVGVDNAYKVLGEFRPFSLKEINDILSQRKVVCPEMENIIANPWKKDDSIVF